MSNNLHPKAIRLIVHATLFAVAIIHTTPLHAQDADIRKQLQGVDLTGVKHLTLSPDGELAAGLTKLYDNPGKGAGSYSLVKVWSVKDKQLLHQFRVRGAVYEAVFSPDGSTLVSADRSGNLGYATTIRAWNLADGSEHEGGGRFAGLSNKFCFSPDGNRLAAIQFPEYSWLNPLGEYAFKLFVWQVKESEGLIIKIPNALGDHRATFPFATRDGVALSDERVRRSIGRVTPELKGFSPDGKHLICDFETGPRTFDARTGRILQRSEICSVGLLKSMLMIAPQQVPADVKSLSIEIMPRKKSIRLERAADGWWRTEQDQKYGFKVDGKHFVSREGDLETKEEIRMLLGMKDDSSLADLSSLKHPVGVIKIDREETGLKFRLEEVTDGTDLGETLQTGEVLWTPTVSNGEELPKIQLPGSDAWKQLRSNEQQTLWSGAPGNYYILQTYKTPRALPLDDIDKFRAYARKQAAAMNGGLVEAKFMQCDGRKAGYFIVKNTYKDLMGYRYIGRCVIPVEGGAYEVRMVALPVGITGKREAVLNIKLGLLAKLTMEEISAEAPPTPGNPPRKPGDKRIKGIFKDPYDAKFDAAATYSPTDDAKFDAQFPHHPLSRLRDKLPKLIESVVIKDEEADHAGALRDIRAIIESGRDSKSMPADMLVRLYTDAIGADEHDNTKERWEFSAGKVHRLVINDSKGAELYRREKTLAFDTTNICRHLLDGKLFVIAAGEGTGKTRMFAGTAFEGAVGERAIEILIDGETAIEVGESCLFGGLSKTDALAFNALYEQLASQARNAFGATGVQATENSTRLAVSILDEEHGGIYLLHADGSGKQRLTKGRSDILPRWSPNGKQIAFLALREQDHELAAAHDLAYHWFLYVMDADGQNQRRVTKTPIGMIFQWSPDGTRFVFQSSCEDVNNKAKDGTASSAIYVMTSDGTQQKRLTPVENNDCLPSWSPIGKQIAFCSNRHGNKDIFVMNADGSDVRRVTSNEANDSAPTWSPDGKQIAFTSSRESGTAYVVNADGTEESSLAVRGRPVAWSPNGQSLLIENDGQLILTGEDGSNPKELTQEGKPALNGEYSPDGKAVFYRSNLNGTWTLMSVDIEHSSHKRIWSDSGKFLGFSVCEKKRNDREK